MTTTAPFSRRPAKRLRILALLAIVFGAMTVFSGGGVIFGPQSARDAAGAYVTYVVWFNFLAGFAYVVAGIGIWRGAGWARGLSVAILATTGLVATAFGIQVATGGAFEMRTVAAMALRVAVWAGIVTALRRAGR